MTLTMVLGMEFSIYVCWIKYEFLYISFLWLPTILSHDVHKIFMVLCVLLGYLYWRRYYLIQHYPFHINIRIPHTHKTEAEPRKNLDTYGDWQLSFILSSALLHRHVTTQASLLISTCSQGGRMSCSSEIMLLHILWTGVLQ